MSASDFEQLDRAMEARQLKATRELLSTVRFFGLALVGLFSLFLLLHFGVAGSSIVQDFVSSERGVYYVILVLIVGLHWWQNVR